MLRDEKTDEATSRIENIYEMLRAIADFPNIAEFMEHASLVMDNDALADDLGGSVTIMTLHAAKGLEFDLVFIPSMEEGIFPHQRAIDQDGQKGIEEERRIAYVGITRARKELYLTFAERRRMFYETCYNAPSRFIAEIPDHISIKKSSNSY
jgi:DNA helicase-2/ATP-dependent DNA helicase PcrA